MMFGDEPIKTYLFSTQIKITHDVVELLTVGSRLFNGVILSCK